MILYWYFILFIIFLLVLVIIKYLWGLIGLLSDYHNKIWDKTRINLYKNNLSRDVICISPKAIHKGKQLIEKIIDHAHNIIGHFGQFKTAQYIRRYFCWPMSHNIESYCKSCGICTTSKDANSKLTGLLHSLPIPD